MDGLLSSDESVFGSVGCTSVWFCQLYFCLF
jgi:hypothetical protein